ncbi:creatininase family protein [Streptacidiphilus jiangxiensis]|uniref:Creatinine amidohydrolase n=1 Tax=Streptacidiphilus jiangxiensis TaxID=235985 RepID=A0A1H7Q6S1_STRJI|nr:creatininase family protein [Streptacidiphilus jiangxiensis]SEL43519.1 creatinine amidohydrolase [Streptacidiphilus jiangxiensis]
MDALITDATSQDEGRRASRVAVLPVGSFEQHGDFLPLVTDTAVACMIAKRIAKDYDLFLLPPITISCSHEHARMPGTVSISAATLHALVNDIWRSLQESGTERLLIVSGHGGNYVLSNVVQEANVRHPRMALFPVREDWNRARLDAGLETTTHDDMHGGELEVSLLLHAAPELVRPGYEGADHDAPERPHLLTLGMTGYTPNGIIGAPSHGTAAKGASLLASLSRSAVAHLEILSKGY